MGGIPTGNRGVQGNSIGNRRALIWEFRDEGVNRRCGCHHPREKTNESLFASKRPEKSEKYRGFKPGEIKARMTRTAVGVVDEKWLTSITDEDVTEMEISVDKGGLSVRR